MNCIQKKKMITLKKKQKIESGNIASIKERAGIHSGIVSDVIDALAQTFAESEVLSRRDRD